MRKMIAAAATTALFALSLGAAAQTEQSQAGQATFTPFRQYSNFALFIDRESMHGDANTGDAVMTIKILLSTPNAAANPKYPVKSFINTLFLECEKDQVTVLVSQAYDVDDDLVLLRRFYHPIQNPHEEGTPVTEVLDFACGTNPKYPNKRNKPAPVTPDDQDSV